MKLIIIIIVIIIVIIIIIIIIISWNPMTGNVTPLDSPELGYKGGNR